MKIYFSEQIVKLTMEKERTVKLAAVSLQSAVVGGAAFCMIPPKGETTAQFLLTVKSEIDTIKIRNAFKFISYIARCYHMKRFLSVLLCAALLVGIAALSGCKAKNSSLSGTEIAKMLLANQRLNPSDLDLGLEEALTGTTKEKPAEALSAVNSYKPVAALLSTSQSGNTVQWRDFTDESNTYSFFISRLLLISQISYMSLKVAVTLYLQFLNQTFHKHIL